MQASNFGKIRRTSDSFENSSVIQRKIWQFYRTVILRKNLHQRCAERFAPCIRSVAGQNIFHRNTVPSQVIMPADAAVSACNDGPTALPFTLFLPPIQNKTVAGLNQSKCPGH
jgi:hypothetical protein